MGGPQTIGAGMIEHGCAMARPYTRASWQFTEIDSIDQLD